MKKVLSIVLAIAMIATMSVAAFAAAGDKTLTATTGTASFDVNGTYKLGTKTDKYKVVITWDDFTYEYGSGETWNPETHNWDLTAGGAWDIEDKNITVTNHSSKAVNASAAYVATLAGTDFEFAGEGPVATADGTAVDAAPSITIVATFKDNGKTIQSNQKLGTITVTIA